LCRGFLRRSLLRHSDTGGGDGEDRGPAPLGDGQRGDGALPELEASRVDDAPALSQHLQSKKHGCCVQ